MAKKKKRRGAALKRWAQKIKTKKLATIAGRHFGKERGRRVAVGLRAWALGISIRQLAKRGRKARKKRGRKR